jgi:hypothetical protein
VVAVARKTSPILVLLVCIVVAGCSLKAKWRDASNQGRTDEQAQADYNACYQQSVLPPVGSPLPPGTTTAEMDVLVTKTKACMQARGWELVRVDT